MKVEYPTADDNMKNINNLSIKNNSDNATTLKVNDKINYRTLSGH